MKRLFLFLTVLLMLLTAVPATAVEPFHYENTTLGFSLTVPSLPMEEIAVDESDTRVDFYHAPSQEKYGGLIGSIEVVSPRSKFFSEEYNNLAHQVLAMGEDRIFLWKSPGGGVDSGGEVLEAFVTASSTLSVDNLRKHLVPLRPDTLPILNTQHNLGYLPTKDSLVRPDTPLTRGELAEMLYALLVADNKIAPCEDQFSDVTNSTCAHAVNYLASYGILSGYSDGTFRPEAPISRAAFAASLHRCQFSPPVGRYGDTPDFPDVPSDFWAAAYIHSADTLDWMTGYPDGLFRPTGEVTRAQAVTAINRMLGRDESLVSTETCPNPFTDLDNDHWAYRNVLEATGTLIEMPEFVDKPLPEETTAYYFANETDGWAISNSQLCRTVDSGKHWKSVGKPLSFTVSDLFFFSDHEGLLLGNDENIPCLLLKTTDGGETWNDFLADSAVQSQHLPMEHFATAKSMLDSIVTAELRLASKDSAFLTIWYHPYESNYVRDFSVAKRTVITAKELHSIGTQTLSKTSSTQLIK